MDGVEMKKYPIRCGWRYNSVKQLEMRGFLAHKTLIERHLNGFCLVFERLEGFFAVYGVQEVGFFCPKNGIGVTLGVTIGVTLQNEMYRLGLH